MHSLLPSRAACVAAILAVGALVGCDAAGPDTAGLDLAPADARQERVPVCHYSPDTDTYELITVAAPAAATHDERHDRDYVGADYESAAVPGMEGSTFDEACQPQSDQLEACFVSNEEIPFDLTISPLDGRVGGRIDPEPGVIFDIEGDVTDPAGAVSSVGAVEALDFRATLREPSPGFVDFADVSLTRGDGDEFAGTLVTDDGDVFAITGPLTAGPCPEGPVDTRSATASESAVGTWYRAK